MLFTPSQIVENTARHHPKELKKLVQGIRKNPQTATHAVIRVFLICEKNRREAMQEQSNVPDKIVLLFACYLHCPKTAVFLDLSLGRISCALRS